MFETLPDFPQAKHLAAALWRREGQARGAALIVGAGVSTMAHTASEQTPKPPLWKGLTKSLGKRLYPLSDALAPTDALRLAQEYLSYFGQAALNAHLRELIVDSAWFPSSTHKRLLQLPWADILTTNYDTLLERAATEILTPAYDVVKSATDLVHARQPRIVKLHGSIGDESPLVLTEEDYRIYPSRNAAMVNLARQVFIENELCLLGFSGDDPNFLQWTGWVRDNLQGAHRKIYLVGVLQLSPSARRLLEDRNIAPIDLAPLVKDRPKSEQHAAATVLFLEFLEQEKPPPVHEWRLSNEDVQAFVPADTQADRDRLAAREKLRIRIARWCEERLRYPGWVVCPEEYRDRLKVSCLSASRDMQRALSALEADEQAAFLAEYAWRCHTALCSPTDEQIQCLEQVLPGDESAALSASQVECAFLLLTRYRDVGDLLNFNSVDARMKRSELTTIQQSRLSYERALLARDLMRLEELHTLIESIDGEDPMWKLRRAALACDLNMWSYVRQQWLEAASDIRKREQADRTSIWIRSRRALLEFISMIDWENRGEDSFADSRIRSIQNRISHCDPWVHMEYAREEMHRIRDGHRQSRGEAQKIALTPGAIRKNENSVNAQARSLRRELQRWDEWAGIPIRFKQTSLGQLSTEALTLAPELTLPNMLLMVRGTHGSKKSYIDKNFNHLNLAKTPKVIRDEATSTLLDACKFWRDRITREADEDAVHAHQEDLGTAMSVLGKFILAADQLTAQKGLDLAFDIAEHNRDIDWRQYEALGNLFEGAISALPLHDANLALRCASIPLTSELSGDLMDRHWPEPAQWLNRLQSAQNTYISPLNKGRIDHLLEAAGRFGSDRVDALIRLDVLLDMELLDPEQKDRFGAALWSRRDSGNPSLPTDMPFRFGTLRKLPAPSTIDVHSCLCERLFTGPKFSLPEDDSIIEMVSAVTGPHPTLPTATVAAALLGDLLQLHPRLQSWLAGSSRESFHRARARRVWLGLAVGRALVPAMQSSDLTLEQLNKVLEFMDQMNSSSAVIALPYFAPALPSEVSRLVYRVQVALLDAASGNVASGAEAIRVWLRNDTLRACLSSDQILTFHELVLTSLGVSSGQSEPEVLRTARALLEMNLSPAYACRLAKSIQLILRRTQPDQVLLGVLDEVNFSSVRAEAIRAANALLSAGVLESEELRIAVQESTDDPLPEVRYALWTLSGSSA